ncbi:TPA: Phr family secreted Rap phosphatase inhibitor [Bacillus cereus]|uniref:Phr family secreted Rap phosphatase inhibitor n=1 Tax=Bacillus cereus group TaxID=86661 RepID=UPI000BED636C|nr:MULTISPECIES: Phr family secreted Rap phosphatase inhibitor [Bacillus cereus group]MEB9945306.1 Phr family secreted Rap phosphatase inhibitor [Bacillus cereus]PDZ53816.1 Phr family secreted Rap phosphatase inhibitor [Bacillus cereus]PED04600.1 Phr family secreted Rap phosphatase inhibitor [Bacillus cereus]PED89435.1 Phr family secreted Rap phosphatase inhibitor [Bacillus cereus]PEQ37174.1 Phr family secreted Rap phosphatase inhibitor [Bacillus cereus]
MKKIKKIVLSMVVISALACGMNSLHSPQQSSSNGGDTPAPTIPSVSVEVSIH